MPAASSPIVEDGKNVAVVRDGELFSVMFKSPYMGLTPVGTRLIKSGYGHTTTPPSSCRKLLLQDAITQMRAWDHFLEVQKKHTK